MNEEKFSGKADVYAKYRPTYPVDFIDYLYNEVGLCKNSVIADIGSGTGKLTELLLKRDSFVYGIEPNDDMRSKAESSLQMYKNFVSVNAAAENTGLPDASVDFVTVAQAFHWFDRAKFKAECQRILKNRGKVILVMNGRVSEGELATEIANISREYCPDFHGFSGGSMTKNPEIFIDFYNEGIFDNKIFRHESIFDKEKFIGRMKSSSYALKETDERYAQYIAALEELFDKYSNSGYITTPNITRSYVGEV